MNSVKTKKIGSSILKALSEIIFEDAKDSLLKKITITYCDVNKDLSICKVYFTTLDDVEHKQLEKELNDDTAKYLRSSLAHKIDLRNTPELIFKYDESISYGDKIEKIIDKLHKDE